jgi:hypothetical protein
MEMSRGDRDKPGRPFTADGDADAHELVFRERVKWWGG